MDTPTIPDWLARSNRRIGQFVTATPAQFSLHLPHPWSNSAKGHLTAIGFHQHNSHKMIPEGTRGHTCGGQSCAKMPALFLNKSWFPSHCPFEQEEQALDWWEISAVLLRLLPAPHEDMHRSLCSSKNPGYCQQVLYQELIAAQRTVNDPINCSIWDRLPRSQRPDSGR